ncbi:MAG: hypothetical protein AAFY15_06065, partial [Cyanobacteria bacterium J06648_11]
MGTDLSYFTLDNGTKVPLSNVSIDFKEGDPYRSSAKFTPLEAVITLYEIESAQGEIALAPFVGAELSGSTVRRVTIQANDGDFLRVTPNYVWKISHLITDIPLQIPQDLYIGRGVRVDVSSIAAYEVWIDGGYQAVSLEASRAKRIASAFSRTYSENAVFGRWEVPIESPVEVEEQRLRYVVDESTDFIVAGRAQPFQIHKCGRDELDFSFLDPRVFREVAHRSAVVLERGRLAVHVVGVSEEMLTIRVIQLNAAT